MLKHSFTIQLVLLFLFVSCTNVQSQNSNTNLSAVQFAEKIKELPNAPILDVRTPEEYSKGHLAHSLNYDWNGDNFDQQIANLDKTKPVLVYCLSGGRSGSAARAMRKMGFSQVYEMEGGIMKWRGANLPETTDTKVASNGMTLAQFQQLLATDKIVLIDFYADWCAPCKKMKPYLDEISRDMQASVIVTRINADDNQQLCKELHIDALPVLQVYKQGKLTWNHSGFIEKAAVLEKLK
ncbi:MAG: thioredoxin [Bacteroidetes bacterium]|nr:thioredoxin [Bacteroidota bacterium]MBS1740304.1 thioredoxin [Bacteroidota bacterium]MBS1775152.1 thioredoxin [Bacteroidota bacterium]